MFMVMYAPGGIASLIMLNLRVASFGKLRQLLPTYLALAVAGLIALCGAAAMIEMVYQLQLGAVQDGAVRFLGTSLDARGAGSWLGALALLAIGAFLFERTRRRFAVQWGQVQEYIENELKQREAA